MAKRHQVVAHSHSPGGGTSRGLVAERHTNSLLEPPNEQESPLLPSFGAAGEAEFQPICKTILEEIEKRTDYHTFHTWFTPLRVTGLSAGALIFRAPNRLMANTSPKPSVCSFSRPRALEVFPVVR